MATYIQSGNVVFTSSETDTSAITAALERARDSGSRDEATVVGRTLFLRTPDGLGRSVLAAQLARASGPLAATGSATARNWATVTKLLAMCRA